MCLGEALLSSNLYCCCSGVASIPMKLSVFCQLLHMLLNPELGIAGAFMHSELFLRFSFQSNRLVSSGVQPVGSFSTSLMDVLPHILPKKLKEWMKELLVAPLEVRHACFCKGGCKDADSCQTHLTKEYEPGFLYYERK